jgi:predicted glutamine amidotransferase
MCIIALKPEKHAFTKAELKIMWDSNPDGAGIMYAAQGKLHVVKGLMTLNDLWNAIQKIGPLRKMVIHFRIKTHGAVSPELTHPFWIVEDRLGMVHNGVIRPLVNETSDAESDTAVFARKFAGAYENPFTAIKHEFHRDMLESYIGYSKMVFMDHTGATYILNEHLGEWSKNVWYSNDRYKKESGKSSKTERFPWELGKFENTDREEVQKRLEEAFRFHARRESTGKSENARKREKQKPLLGLPSTQVHSRWEKADN